MVEIEERTLTIQQANLYGFLTIPLVLLITLVPYTLLWGGAQSLTIFSSLVFPLYRFIPILIISIFLHELLHGIGWGLIGGTGWENISFGIKQFTPYCHCEVPLSARAYRFGTLLPGLVLGFIPAVIALLLESPFLMGYSALMLMSAGGDLIIIWLLRDLAYSRRVEDHPSAVGCRVYPE